jgi:hypothetical protein
VAVSAGRGRSLHAVSNCSTVDTREVANSSPPEPPARLDRAERGRERLRRERLAEERRLGDAADSMSTMDVFGTVLDDNHLVVLLRLLDLALATRTGGMRRPSIAAASHGVRLELRPRAGFSTVTTKQGQLRLDGYDLHVSPAAHTAAPRLLDDLRSSADLSWMP